MEAFKEVREFIDITDEKSHCLSLGDFNTSGVLDFYISNVLGGKYNV